MYHYYYYYYYMYHYYYYYYYMYHYYYYMYHYYYYMYHYYYYYMYHYYYYMYHYYYYYYYMYHYYYYMYHYYYYMYHYYYYYYYYMYHYYYYMYHYYYYMYHYYYYTTTLMIDFVDVEEIDEQPSPRTLNTHLPFSMLPVQEIKDKRTKIVHVYRNPKAVVVSMYFMAKTAGETGTANESAHGFDSIWKGKIPPYSCPPGTRTRQLRIRSRDPVTNIRQLAKFLEVDVSDKLCEEIAEACSFQNMKNNFIEKSPARFGGGHVGDFQGGPGGEKTPTTDKAEKNKQAAVIFRKGETDDWKNYLTVAMSEKLDAVAMEKMKGLPFTLHYT
nr:hypothetical protein BaRGS_025262 [Batillaria attramentaria]